MLKYCDNDPLSGEERSAATPTQALQGEDTEGMGWGGERVLLSGCGGLEQGTFNDYKELVRTGTEGSRASSQLLQVFGCPATRGTKLCVGGRR